MTGLDSLNGDLAPTFSISRHRWLRWPAQKPAYLVMECLFVTSNGGYFQHSEGWLRCDPAGGLQGPQDLPLTFVFSLPLSATPSKTRSQDPSLLDPLPLAAAKGFLCKQTPPSIFVSWPHRALTGTADSEEVKGVVPGLHLTDGLRQEGAVILSWPQKRGLSGRCRGGGLVVPPGGLTDTSSCWGTRVPGPRFPAQSVPLRARPMPFLTSPPTPP